MDSLAVGRSTSALDISDYFDDKTIRVNYRMIRVRIYVALFRIEDFAEICWQACIRSCRRIFGDRFDDGAALWQILISPFISFSATLKISLKCVRPQEYISAASSTYQFKSGNFNYINYLII